MIRQSLPGSLLALFAVLVSTLFARTCEPLARGEGARLLTGFGIEPHTATVGMLETDPKRTVTFETVPAVPLT